MSEESPRKRNILQSCLSFIGGGCLGCGFLIALITVGLICAISCFDDSEEKPFSNISSKEVPGFNRNTDDYIAVIPVHGVIMYGKTQSGVVVPAQFSRILSPFLVFSTKISDSHTNTAAAPAAKKILALGIKEVVPSLFVICSALESTAAPMAGPMTPGINT